MFEWLFSRQAPPADNPTDHVIPSRFWDSSAMVPDIVMRGIARFDDILDPEKLHDSLDRLLSRDDGWGRLGGRLRKNPKGKVEYHIPTTYSAARPRLRYAHAAFDDTPISEHPLASRLPIATSTASVQFGSDVFRELTARDGTPATLNDYYTSDEPPLELNVFTFRDATLVVLTLPHMLTDGVGLSSLLENWCRVLAGRDDEVLPLADGDLLATISEAGVEQHVLEPLRLSGLSGLRFGLNYLWDMIFGPKMEIRTICLPPAVLITIKQQAKDSIPSDQVIRREEQTKPLISEGDVLAAWSTKLIAQSLGPQNTRTLTVFNVFEFRSRLPNLFPSGVAYVLNAYSTINTFFAVSEAQSLPLGAMALQFRISRAAQTTPGQVEALVRAQRASIEATGRPALFAASSDSMLVPITNWSGARFYDVVDFGPAVVGAKKGEGAGKPVFFLAFDASPRPSWTLRHVINIIGKDRQGNCWISGILAPEAWRRFEEEIAKM